MMDESNEESLPQVPTGLFKDVKYYFIGKISELTEKLLNGGGARKEQYLSELLTHCIADEEDDEAVEAKELFQLTVVKSAWVFMSVRCGQLLPTSPFDPECKRNVFKDVTICPSQISAKDNKAVWALVTCFGGQYQTKLNQNVTHLVTTSVNSVKYELAHMHSDRLKIVTPDWVTDCAARKTRLDEMRYHPRLVQAREATTVSCPRDGSVEVKQEIPPVAVTSTVSIISSPKPDSASAKVTVVAAPNSDSAARVIVASPAPKPDNSRTKVTPARAVSNRQLAQQASALRLKESIIGINRLGLDQELVLPPQARPHHPLPPQLPPLPPQLPPPLPMTQSPAPVTRPMMVRQPVPLSMLPHARPQLPPPPPPPPVPREVVPRHMLRNIANSSGAEPKTPKHMPRSNSNKIPRQISPGRSAAMGIFPNMAAVGKSHVSGEVKIYYGHDPGENIPENACLLGCVFYITDYQKYLEASTLDTWKQAITQFGGQVDDSYSNRITHVLCEHQKSDVFQLALRDGKRLVTAHWLNDCLLAKKMKTPWMALHFPFVFGKEKPCTNQIICVTNFVDEDRVRIKHMITLLGARYTGYMSRANSVLITKRPGGNKYEKALEWRLPVVNVQWLNDLILGDLSALKLPIQMRYATFSMEGEFHVDIQRVMHLLEGWKIPVKISKETWKKFQSSQVLKSLPNAQVPQYLGSTPSNQANEGPFTPSLKHHGDLVYDGIPEKRPRMTSPAVTDYAWSRGPVVLITGIPRNRSAILAQEVERLGGKIALAGNHFCTHIVSPGILRTVKFLTAFSHVRHIVMPDWIEQSSRANRFLDETCFAIRDEIAETTFNFKLHESLRRARERRLFQELIFYITPDVMPSKSILSEMAESAGGKVSKTLPPLSSITRLVNGKSEPMFVVISCEKDLYLCKELAYRNIGIHSSEFIITGILRQEIDYFTHRL